MLARDARTIIGSRNTLTRREALLTRIRYVDSLKSHGGLSWKEIFARTVDAFPDHRILNWNSLKALYHSQKHRL